MLKRISGIIAIVLVMMVLSCPNPSAPEKDKVVSIREIEGLVAPQLGATPVTAITGTDQYTGTVAWSNSPTTFAASTVYTATITLTAKAGYTLTGVAANFFTVEGATATNPANSGVITAVFPATADGSYTSTNIGILKYVPAGSFQRNSKENNISVITKPYRMSQHQITRQQFLDIMGTDPSNDARSSGMSDPVGRANWYHAIAFCNKLSIKEGLTAVYSVTVDGEEVNWGTLPYADVPTSTNALWNAATINQNATGYRLPTDMEWMWAAMGADKDRREDAFDEAGINRTGYTKGYAGSNEAGKAQTNIGDYAWYSDNSDNKTHPVGEKLPNELGLYDMSGNVWEWCWDAYYDGIPDDSLIDYTGDTSGSLRIARGGSFIEVVRYIVLSVRSITGPNSQIDDFGFRVVRP